MSRLGLDGLVTAVLLVVGLAGLWQSTAFADRAAIWPRAVFAGLAFFAAIHLAALARRAIAARKR